MVEPWRGLEAVPNKFGTAEHWRARAQEARWAAHQIQDADARQAMLDIAESYEKIATRAEAKEVGVPVHSDGRLTRDT